MGLNQKDRDKVDKTLRDKGFSLKPDGTYSNGKGDKATLSPTRASIKLNDTSYNTTSGVKNSRHLNK